MTELLMDGTRVILSMLIEGLHGGERESGYEGAPQERTKGHPVYADGGAAEGKTGGSVYGGLPDGLPVPMESLRGCEREGVGMEEPPQR